MSRDTGRRGSVFGMIAGLVALGASVGTGVAAPAAAAPSTLSILPGNTAPVPPGATLLGALPADASVPLEVTLQPRDPQLLAQAVQAVSTPGSPDYRHFVSKGAFAHAFGPTHASIAAVRAALGSEGLSVGPVSSTGLDLPVRATAAQVESAFGLHLNRYRLDTGSTGYANDGAPRVPASVVHDMVGIIGLDTLSPATMSSPLPPPAPPRPATSTVRPTPALASPPVASTSQPTPTAACQTNDINNLQANFGAWDADQLAQAYSFGPLYAANDFGAGQTVALVELENGYLSNDIKTFAACYGITLGTNQISNVPVDGGPSGTGGGTDEVELDIETVLSLAPNATIDVYEGTGSLFDVFNAIVGADSAKVISSSWTNGCEADLSAGTMSSENTLFETAALQGQSILEASGDEGSEGCNTNGEASVSAGSHPMSQAVAPATSTLYVANKPSSVTLVNENTGDVAATVFVGSTPDAVVVDPNDAKVFVANGGSNSLSVFSSTTCNSETTSSCAVTAIPATGTPPTIDGPTALGLNPQTSTLYVGNKTSNAVAAFNAATNAYLGSVPLPSGANPTSIAVNAATNTVYVTDEAHADVLDFSAALCQTSNATGCGALTPASIGVGTDPVASVIAPITNQLYVANLGTGGAGEGVSVIALASNTVTSTISTAAIGAFSHQSGTPESLALSPNGADVLVALEGMSYPGSAIGTINPNSSTIVAVVGIETPADTDTLASLVSDPTIDAAWVLDQTQGQDVEETYNLAVEDPASQPNVTAVGGTTLTALGPAPTESVWNEASFGGSAGGGGISSVYAMPGFQKALGQVSGSSGTPCGNASGDCREVPDVSADADPFSGYVVYDSADNAGGWIALGGTSAAAPLWAAVLADDASASANTAGYGPLNPTLYFLAANSPGTYFNDVTTGTNDFNETNAGQFPALSGYDMATGLGTPIASNLASGFASFVPPTKLVFSTQPGGGTAGSPWSQQPVVTIENSLGLAVIADTSTITLSLATNPGSGHLTGCTATTTGGVAHFSGCQIDVAAGGYSLTATDSADVLAATSQTFSITPGSASQLVFSTQPGGGTAAKAWSQQPVVSIEDAEGNVETSDSAPIALSLSTNPGAGVLSGCAATTSAGVATFSGCQIDKAAAGYVMKAADSIDGLNLTSGSFTITPGKATQLVFSTQPGGGTAAQAWSQQPVVTIEDAQGNVETSDTGPIVLSLSTNPGSGTLTGCTATTSAGVATFSGCQINKAAAGYVMKAADATDGLNQGSSTFTINPGAPTQLVFSTQPGGGTAAQAWSQQPVVTIEDAQGNVETSDTGPIVLSLSTNPGSGTLTGCTATTSGGVASFSGCRINKAAVGYVMKAADSTDGVSQLSVSFSIAPGAPTQLVFSTQPGGGTAAQAWSQQPVVAIEDAQGNVETSDTSPIVLSLSTNPGSGSLTGCTATTISGMASFSGCQINKAAAGYVIKATDSIDGINQTSTLVTIAAGQASQLVFLTQPGGGTAAHAWAQQPVVAIEDGQGNLVTTDTATIALTLTINPGSGTLTGCAATTTAGVASFSGCQINKATVGYVLRGTDSVDGLNVTSSSFAISPGPASQLVFTTQPGGGTAAKAWTQQPVIAIEDAEGNVETSDSSPITLSVSTNPGSGTLSGCTATSNTGIATFSGCQIDKAATGYGLTADDMTDAVTQTSALFTVNSGPASQLVFTTQPGGGTAAKAWTQQPVIAIEDAEGNVETSDSSPVTLSLSTNPGSGSLTGCSATTSAGVAAFSGCQIDKAASGYVLKATDSLDALTAISASVSINPGAPSQLVFTIQPGGGTAAQAWTQQPVVVIEDAGGNVETSDASTITLSLSTDPGSGSLTGCSATTSAGVAAFSGCQIDKAASGYVLTANDGGDSLHRISASFSVAPGVPSQLVFTIQPGGGPAAQAWTPEPVVAIEDAEGNVVSSDTAVITISLSTNPGSGALTGCSGSTRLGVVAFSGCAINKAASGYVVSVVDQADTLSASSSPFAIAVGTPSTLVFSTEPGGGSAATSWSQQPVVTIEDAGGNVVSADTAPITLSLSTNPASGTLTGCAATTLAGLASFSGCQINTAATGDVLTAVDSIDSLSVQSSTFAIAPGSPSRLVFTAEPGGGTTGTVWARQPAVAVEDAEGNVISSERPTITLALTTNPGSASLTGCAATSTPGGATFSGCQINAAASGDVLTATDGTDSLSVASAPFTVSAPPPPPPVAPTSKGYWLVASDGGIFAFGDAGFYGSTGSLHLNKPIVGMSATPDGKGYWLVASDGGIFAFGDAGFYGSTGSLHLNKPIVGMSATPDGKGYWLVASDGGIFAFGDAGFYGSTGAITLNQPIVSMTPVPDGGGYWLMASDGGIFAFGNARFFGSAGYLTLNHPIVSLAPTPDGQGYWLVGSDGGIFAFGDAPYLGSTGALHLNRPIVDMAATADGGGYWLVATDGGIFSFGDAPFFGSTGALHLNQPIVGMAGTT